jgi:gluconokinase
MSTVLDEVALDGALDLAPSLLASSLRAEPEGSVALALDIGTSGVRAVLFDGRGNAIEGSQVALSNSLYREIGGGSDADADTLVQLAAGALDLLAARADGLVSRVDYVAASCFWHSLLGVDSLGHATTPLFGWADTRAAKFADELRSSLDEGGIHARTGCRFHPSYWPAKLLWLRAERSELFEKTKQWLSFSDYFALRLFGETATSVSMASATGLFNQHVCAWDPELLRYVRLSQEQLAPIAPPGKTCQRLRDQYARRWPLLDHSAWFPAIGDGAANNIGAGCATRDQATLMIGTSGAMRVVFVGEPPASLPPQVFCYRADRDRLVVGGALSDGGGLIRWMKDELALEQLDDELESTVAALEPDAHGLTILPFWSGERSTGWSGSARGAIIGLTSRTNPSEILRAAMEAICYRFALLARALDAVAPETTIFGAGNALLASPVWAQILADVLGRQIRMSREREASCRGAALLALEAAGEIGSIETVRAEFGEVYLPDMTRHTRYAQAIERQQEIYGRLVN